jgi:hypothetical protein
VRRRQALPFAIVRVSAGRCGRQVSSCACILYLAFIILGSTVASGSWCAGSARFPPSASVASASERVSCLLCASPAPGVSHTQRALRQSGRVYRWRAPRLLGVHELRATPQQRRSGCGSLDPYPCKSSRFYNLRRPDSQLGQRSWPSSLPRALRVTLLYLFFLAARATCYDPARPWLFALVAVGAMRCQCTTCRPAAFVVGNGIGTRVASLTYRYMYVLQNCVRCTCAVHIHVLTTKTSRNLNVNLVESESFESMRACDGRASPDQPNGPGCC